MLGPTPPSQAVILVGGLGTRLGELTKGTPKPLLKIRDIPFLEYLVWNLSRHGVKNLVFAAGFLGEQIKNYFGDGSHWGVKIIYSIEAKPLGTGGALRNALPFLNEIFYVLNGDTLFDINLHALWVSLLQAPTSIQGVIALRHVADVTRYGLVRIETDVIQSFSEKSASGHGDINGGIYLLKRSVVDTIPSECKQSLETDCFPDLVAKRALNGIPLSGYFLDIGLPETYEQAQRELPAWKHRPVAFLDRDGVINKDINYLHRAEDCQWIDGAIEAIRWLNENRYLVIVVTNQAGIARGFYTEEDFIEFMHWYQSHLARHGAHLDDVFYSPYHPIEGLGAYKKKSDCRKPNPGMLRQALAKWKPQQNASFLIGDKPSDLAAAEALGISSFLFKEGNLFEFLADSVLATLSSSFKSLRENRLNGSFPS